MDKKTIASLTIGGVIGAGAILGVGGVVAPEPQAQAEIIEVIKDASKEKEAWEIRVTKTEQTTESTTLLFLNGQIENLQNAITNYQAQIDEWTDEMNELKAKRDEYLIEVNKK